ncbi:WD40 repeat domain-containing protein [Streptomyces chilikensis]|uniref:WD40 repeat domain-containing protein n=1 Tax=Streptomyces chilikensis TaxID=1194079 RepID=A0ABV3EY70_9ACTN
MNGIDEAGAVVRAALREQAAAQAPAEPLLVERVLTAHRRRARRRIGGVAAVVAAVVGLAFWSPLPGGSGSAPIRDRGPSTTEVAARPDQSPPRDVIEAGDVVMAGYVEQETTASGTSGRGELRRTYWLLDPDSQTYEKDERWSLVAVAPGGLQAAVLERELPVRRIGILDLRTREVERWIELDGDERQGIAGLAYSRDGGSLVATTYLKDPDSGVPVPVKEEGQDGMEVEVPFDSGRSGFWVVDVASGRGRWSAVETLTDPFLLNARQDFEFTHDGKAVRAGLVSDARSEFHDLDGLPIGPPEGEAHWEWSVEAGRSPDGSRMAGPFAGRTRETSSWILDARTGKKVAEVPGQQLLAWAGKDQLVAWDTAKDGGSEFGNRLVLVTVGSDRTVPLSGPRGDEADGGGRWQPIFVRR